MPSTLSASPNNPLGSSEKPKLILDEVLSTQKELDLQEFEPVRFVQDLLADLDARAKNIVLKRFGIEGGRPKTLESLGKQYGITRERVRQIESLSLKEVRKGAKSKRLARVSKLLHATLQEAGGVMEQGALLDAMLGEDKASPSNRAAMLFLLTLSDEVKQYPEADRTKAMWASNQAAFERLSKVLQLAQQLFEDGTKPLTFEALFGKVQGRAKEQGLELTEAEVRTALATSKTVAKNPFGEFGLVAWTDILPKGVRDKAYLVVRREAKPLHFMQITEKINATKFDKRKAYPQTVHNELIKDKRFVLVGRGIYALSEWGYKPGTVADVLTEILRGAGGPMERGDLLKEVLKRRLVKRNTVLIGLQDKKRFKRLDGHRYDLVVR
jgi:hypothetical protein